MRVLLAHGDLGVPWFAPSGAGAHVRGLARGFQSLGWEVVVAVPRLGSPVPAPDVRVVPLDPPRRRGGWLAERWEAAGGWMSARTVRGLGAFDLVISRHAGFADPAAFARGPRLVELDAPIAQERVRLGDPAWAHARERRLLRGARVGAVSPWLADFARASGAAEVRVIANGTALRPDPAARDAARAALGLSGLVVWFGGSPRPWHGLKRLPELLAALPEATVVIAGAGAAPTHPRIRSTGWLDDAELARLAVASDVAILPYPDDAPPWFCPLKAYDARAAGLPIVASDAPCTRPWAAAWGHTRLVGPDPLAWRDAIRAAATEPRAPMSRTWADVARSWIAFAG